MVVHGPSYQALRQPCRSHQGSTSTLNTQKRSISAACQGVPVVEALIALFSVVEIVIAYGRVLWILW